MSEVGKIVQLTTQPAPPNYTSEPLVAHVRDVIDQAFENGFETAKLRVQRYLLERVEWLKREAHNGGDFKHLITRADEASYVESVVKEMTAPPSQR